MKVLIKLVPTTKNKTKFKENKNFLGLRINDDYHEPDPMALDDEITIDNPNLSVTNREIRLKWVKGDINISEIEIIPQNIPLAKGGPKEEIAKNTFAGASCTDNPLNCVFSDSDLNEIKNCKGKFVKIGGDAENKNLACMNKCVEKDFDTEEKCLL